MHDFLPQDLAQDLGDLFILALDENGLAAGTEDDEWGPTERGYDNARCATHIAIRQQLRPENDIVRVRCFLGCQSSGCDSCDILHRYPRDPAVAGSRVQLAFDLDRMDMMLVLR